MAADQRKRRFSSAAALGYGLQQGQYRAKKRDFSNFNSHILLKWDDNGKRVVAKDEQIGISLRHLSSFVAAPDLPCSANSKLADVVCVPREIFELDDLTHVLSYEVWQSLFTENERNHLSQFLPQGIELDEVVQALFSGDNFHFGNPCQRWGSSLCSGDVHPDSVIRHEKSLRAIKNESYFELQKYHDNMIRNLQMLKERCTNSKDPDAEILHMMSRSRRYAEKTSTLDGNGYKYHSPEENVLSISESPSTADDKSYYYRDHQKLSAIRDLEIHRRIHNEEVVKDRHEKLVTLAEGVKISPKPKKGEKMQKVNSNPNDGAKYMSYVKISKKQHELVKSMKHSGSSIQSKTLNRVLGNLDSFNVKPYEMFVEEEQKRIHEFWSTLANKDIPAALHKCRIMQSQKRQMMVSLLHEIEEKQNLVKGDKVDENMANSHDEAAEDPLHTDEESSQEASERQQNGIVREGSVSDDDKKSNPSFMQNQSPLPSSPFGVNEEFESSSLENQRSLVNPPLNVIEESDTSPTHNKSSRSTSPPLNVNKEINPMDLNAETDNAAFEKSDLEMPCSPAKNVWASIGLPESESYRGIPTALYASSSEPSVRLPLVFPSQPDVLVDLESDMSEADATKDLLNKHPNHLPFFNHYPNRDGCELLQSLIKDKHQHEKKKTGLELNSAPDVTLHPRLFPGHVYRMDNRHQSESQHLYINPNIHDSLYPDNRYPVQNPSDWSSARIPTPVQTPQFSSGELLNHNWFDSENRTSFAPHSNLGSGSGEDQSLFSVLSQCNTMRSQGPYNHPVGSTDMLIPSTNYVQGMVGGMSTARSSVLPQTGSPFDYLGETDAAVTLQNTNLSWMRLGQQQQQNTDLHDPSGEPY